MNRAIDLAQKSTGVLKASSIVSIEDSAPFPSNRLPVAVCGLNNRYTSSYSSQMEADISFYLLDIASRGFNCLSLSKMTLFYLIALFHPQCHFQLQVLDEFRFVFVSLLFSSYFSAYILGFS